ncbi:DUF6179 domain-containing protein [Clostridium chromiireducens]|uniref:Uncharacterized protein n=1 Tax=Clostridium chromiireducens TaxID=225345 RepID=A0A1V4I6R7_9CLOT|nr:DUF6179 domain-containing protein [Clostridium chromiireducens]OPJ55666.1 hypothetical protein CLCHR_46580 [Clostridium chromiireducens]
MENRQSIEKYSYFVENNFSEDHFLKDVLVACYEKKFLDEGILKRISYERLDILKTQLKYYTKDESSSVMVEVAENLMEGIDYTLGFYLKTFNTLELIIEKLKNESLSQMLETGRDLIKVTVEESKNLLEDIMENKLKINNYSYDDTIDHGISLFFEEYEYFFAPHEGEGSIDYQLYMDNMNYKGIEYIRNYLKILSLENEFCSNFNISEINELLKGYDKRSEELLINVFELVLINSLGLIICGKSLSSLDINSADRELIKNKLENLSVEKLQEEVLKYADKCCSILSIKNNELIDYVRKSAIKLKDWLYESIKVNRLETVFISLNKNEDDEFIEYIDGKKLSNAAFKHLSEEIRECSLIQDKIKLIKNNIKSLEDMIDILNAECLFEGEHIALFKSLSKIELILLTKHISDSNFDREYIEEWYYEFKNYILSLDEKDQESIGEYKERIRVI